MNKLLDRLIEAACAIAVVALTVIVSLQVFNRFVLKTPLAWSEDLAMLLFQWVVFLGAALGVKRLRHFGIELVVRRFPERVRHRVELLTPAVMAIVALVMIVQGWTLLDLQPDPDVPDHGSHLHLGVLADPAGRGAHPDLSGRSSKIRRWRGDPPAEGGHGR